MRALELFVAYALVRGVHVDDDQAVGVLGQDVDAVELRDRIAERWRGVFAWLWNWRLHARIGFCVIRGIQRSVRGARFVDTQREARLRHRP